MFIRIRDAICNVDVRNCSMIRVSSDVPAENPMIGTFRIQFVGAQGIVVSSIDFKTRENAYAALEKIQNGIIHNTKVVNIVNLE